MNAEIPPFNAEHANRTATWERRRFLQRLGWIGVAASNATLLSYGAAAAVTEDVAFAGGQRELVKYPQKRPLIRVTTRPPHLETPFEVFNQGAITPNDAFFVRYHLANIPLSIDADTYRLEVKGTVDKPLSLSLADLKALGEPVEVIAVNQCSGNSRGYSAPRVFGAQLSNGAMGNARWGGRQAEDGAGPGRCACRCAACGLQWPGHAGAARHTRFPQVAGCRACHASRRVAGLGDER